jgi:hypothetical protein
MATQANAINYFSPAKWVVSKVAGEGTHTTIGAALTAASSGDTIVVMPGTYTENNTITKTINICGYGGDSWNNVIVNGTFTVSSAITVALSNMQLLTNSATFLTVSGSSASLVYLTNCYLNCLNNNGISYSAASSTSQVFISHCNGNIATTSITPFVCTSTGTLEISYTDWENTGASTTASTCNATTLNLEWSLLKFPISMTAASVSANFTQINSGPTNSVGLTLATSGTSFFYAGDFQTGTASAISIGTGTTLNLYASQIFSSNTDAITGAGTLNFANLTFTSTSTAMNVTTQSGGSIQGLNTGNAPSSGYLGEQIRSAVGSGSPVTLSNNSPTFITSISLTPGIWSVSGIGNLNGSLTGTKFVIAITNSTSAAGDVPGDSQISIPTMSTTASDLSLTLPDLVFVITSTTTIYLNVNCLFTAGTAKAYGRISAIRIG